VRPIGGRRDGDRDRRAYEQRWSTGRAMHRAKVAGPRDAQRSRAM
jgi:hypothetical protein